MAQKKVNLELLVNSKIVFTSSVLLPTTTIQNIRNKDFNIYATSSLQGNNIRENSNKNTLKHFVRIERKSAKSSHSLLDGDESKSAISATQSENSKK